MYGTFSCCTSRVIYGSYASFIIIIDDDKSVFTSALYSSQDNSDESVIKSYLSFIRGAFFKWPYPLLDTQTISHDTREGSNHCCSSLL